MTKPNKKQNDEKLFTLFACAVTLFTACTKDDGGTRVRTYEIAVRLIYPDDGSLTAAEGSRYG